MRYKISLLLLCCFLLAEVHAQRVAVDVNLNVHHVLGDVTTLERKKFITIHADQTTRDWFENDNLRPDVADHFLNGYDVYMGRNTGAVQWTMNSQVNQDPNRPGFADTTHLASLGTSRRNSYGNQTGWHPFESRTENVLCTQLHPFYPDGQTTNKGWAFSQTDTETEPFGTASGEFYAHYIENFFGQGGSSGEPFPKFIEITNEPLWELGDEIDDAFKFHKTVAREVRKRHDKAVIAGYCTAFPNLEENNFQRWENRWKKFMDEVGEEMDLWSIHLYDFPSISNGQKRLRRGSNVEATMDMLEHYSILKFGEAKPFLITEFGASSHDYRGAWSPYRDYLHNTAANALAMQFMERSNNIAQAINYTMLKAKWGSPSVDNTWQARLLRMQGEPSSFSGSWIYSDRVHFYELWANVRGKRTDVKAAHLDIMSDAYVDGNKAYVILNNLAWEPKELQLNLYGLTSIAADELMVKHYHLADDNPTTDRNPGVIDTTYFSGENLPNTFTIDAEATMILEYSLSEALDQPITANEVKYYATEYLKPIQANSQLTYNIQNVATPTSNGEATLRLGIGRAHGRSLLPTVLVNGTEVEVPTDFRGDAQTDRSTFFGVIEIEVPYDLLEATNTVSITFPDAGGHVSSVSLQVFSFSGVVHRSEGNTLSIPTAETLGLRVFPNPAQTTVTFELASQQPYQLSVYDAQGRQVTNRKMQGRDQLVVEDWPAGVYIYRIRLEDGTEGSGRVVVR